MKTTFDKFQKWFCFFKEFGQDRSTAIPLAQHKNINIIMTAFGFIKNLQKFCYKKLNTWSSPDKSENPFCFFFKNKKIATDSGTIGLEYIKCSAPNHFYANKARHFERKEARFPQKIVILQIPKLSGI